MNKYYILLLSFILILSTFSIAQKRAKKSNRETISYASELIDGMKWRHIGPFRGGRSSAVTGVSGEPNLFYMGTTGGGVWKTNDGGNSWLNISDGFFGSSVGAVAVSEWDNNVIYVGGGESTVRGNVSSGLGMYKSVDAGKTWKHMGLSNSRHIPRIRIHPKNPDLVYAAVLGDLYKSSAERGVYRSKDGGENWEKVLFANNNAGAIELVMDPNNPRILYASTWNIRRTPYSLESGGPGSAIWKSTDGGDKWENISQNKGLPSGDWGISGITVSPVNSNRVWAIIENANGGVFRSDDAGKTWNKTNEDRSLRQRAWYYTRIYADTQDEDMVYVMNVAYHRSKDGGKTFESFNAPHGDHHDLWIAPENNQRMIIADDGGGQVSYDGGENWTTYMNQPTAQFYRVTTDNHFPYRIYGAQQDNSTIRINHRSSDGSIDERDWEPTAGGESAHIAVKPDNSDIVFGGSYDGYLSRYNHKTEELRGVNVWPDNPMGHGAEDFKYRFQWNFPIFYSPHNPDKLYTASNQLHVTTNGGQSWKVISPDLTRNDTTKLGSSGGLITQDNTSVEYYCTIFAGVESPKKEGLIWVGSDDGLVHVTKDGGENWKNVTPSNMPEWTMINSIEIDPFNEGGAYIAGTRYKMGDYSPYLYHTTDYGQTWKKITAGIPNEHFTRVVRADPKRKGLLYAGTEYGMYVSYDNGSSWSSFQLNLPIVPVTDLTIKNNNLIAATQGRSFWLIDDLTPLHQLNEGLNNKAIHLFQPMDSYRMSGSNYADKKREGENHPGGALIHFYLKDTAFVDTLQLTIYDSSNKLVKSFSSKPTPDSKQEELKIKPGMNIHNWDLSYQGADGFDGMILWWASLSGPTAVPGRFTVKIKHNNYSQTEDFKVLIDPRISSSVEDLQAQFDFQMAVISKLTETNNAVEKIRIAKSQVNDVLSKYEKEDYSELHQKGEEITKRLTEIEKELYQTKNRSNQDPLNFPIKLNNKLGHLNSLMGMGDYKPTDQAVAYKKEVTSLIDKELTKLEAIFNNQIPAFNSLVKSQNLDAVVIK